MAAAALQGRRRGGAPAWFLARLPRQALDGELWLGHGRFDEVSALLRRGDPDDPGWRAVQYRVFELPDAPAGSRSGPADRGAGGRHGVAAAGGGAQRPWRTDGPAAVAGRGGGRRRRGPGAAPRRCPQTGRTEALFKFKPVQDAEAVVIGHAGHGKYAGLVGPCGCATTPGRSFCWAAA
jgi:DNA ligase-1